MTLFNFSLSVSAHDAGSRLDRFLARHFPDFSRTQWAACIRGQGVCVNGQVSEASNRLSEADSVFVFFGPERKMDGNHPPQDIFFGVVDENKDYLIVNKPQGLVVHPGSGCSSGTLVNGLIYRYPELAVLPRAGLVHRLDKDTSGVLIVARHEKSYQFLLQEMSERNIEKRYHAIVWGEFSKSMNINKKITRHPVHRTRMTVSPNKGKDSLTLCFPISISPCRRISLIECHLVTGRTHQIRVHLASCLFPLVGDPVYAPPQRFKASPIKRQCLHAHSIRFRSPTHRSFVEHTVPMPDDMKSVLSFFSLF